MMMMMVLMMIMMMMMMMIVMLIALLRVIVMMTLVESLMGNGPLSQMPLWLHCRCIFRVFALYFFGFTLSFDCTVLYMDNWTL